MHTLITNLYTFYSCDTDLPTLSIPMAEVPCNFFNTINLECILKTALNNLQTTVLWHHNLNGQLIRFLEGNGGNNSFLLQIPFCSYQDIGDYTCHVMTDLPGLPTLNASAKVSVKGS